MGRAKSFHPCYATTDRTYSLQRDNGQNPYRHSQLYQLRYLGMHALTTIFEEKRVLGPLDHPVLSDSHLLPSEGPENSLNALERISSGDIPHQLPSTTVALMDTLTVDTPVPIYTVSINKMKIVIKRGSEIHSQKCCHLV